MSLLIDLNNFFLKTVLQVPASHDLLKYRLLLWCPLVLAASEELFDYLTNKYSMRVRAYMWMTIILLAMETGISVRNYDVYSGTPFPLFVKVMWSIILGIILGITVWIIMRKKDRKEEDEEPWNPYDPPMDIKLVK